MPEQPASASNTNQPGSLDRTGAGDHDEPYSGFQTYQFSTRQFARLLQLRGEALEARLGQGRWESDLAREIAPDPSRRQQRSACRGTGNTPRRGVRRSETGAGSSPNTSASPTGSGPRTDSRACTARPDSARDASA